ncbi:hypothetical protein ACFU5Y_39605 [Streptomyces gardneri]|uniref:hypothetical protein n=1 Tax=Streptomyces gardneri TaxID=66892 RepID=UPI00369AD33C
MAVELDDVRALRNAYSRVLDEGDELFRTELLSKKILLAMVAASAADADSWITSRVQNSSVLENELARLVEVLHERNVIGNSLQAVRKWVGEQLWALGSAAVLGTTWPVWVGAVGTAASAWLTATVEAGQATGRLIVPLVLGLLTMGGGVALYMFRGMYYAAEGAGRASSKVSDDLFHRAGAVGTGPEQLFEARVRPALEAIFEKHGRADDSLAGPAPVVGTLRKAAGSSLVLAIVVLAVSLLAFAVGFADALDDSACVPSTSQFCPQ